MSLLFRIFAMSVVMTLVACGGGGGKKGPDPDPQPTPDTTPNDFIFTDQTGVDLLTEFVSNTITVSGIDAATVITITGGEYSIDGGDFNSSNGGINNGQQVVVRQTSSDQFSTTTEAVLTVGGISDTFSLTTLAEDLEPDSFSFVDQADAPRNTLLISNAVTISGINNAVNVSVSGGEYSIDGGEFTDDAGVITNNQVIQVRQASSTDFSVTTDVILTVGGVSDTFSVTTLAEDLEPDPFTFTDLNNVNLNVQVTSDPISIVGINNATEISIVGGEFSVDNADFSSDTTTINNNQQVIIRQTSAAGFSTTTTATLSVGGVSDDFEVTTFALDAVPDQFTFVDSQNVLRSTTVISPPVTITGINAPTAISIDGGLYSLDGGELTSDNGTVLNNQQVRVFQTASDQFSVTTDAVVNVGGITDTFSVTTIAEDVVPDTFSFNAIVDARVSSQVVSNAIQVNGINSNSEIAITGGEYSVDNGTFTNLPSFVTNGQSVVVRQISASGFLQTQATSLTIGGVNGVFSVTTEAQDLTPNSFTFVDKSSVFPGQVVVSNEIAVTGINDSVSITVVGGEYSINGEEFTTEVGQITRFQSVRVRNIASNQIASTTDTILDIGGVSDTFSVSTIEEDPFIEIHFPGEQSLTENNEITVRGTTFSTMPNIEEVLVNGIPASSNDGFVNWQATIPLSLGENNINAVAVDSMGNNLGEVGVAVKRAVPVGSINRITVSPDGNVYAVDDDSVLELDISTADADIISGPETDMNLNPINSVQDIAFDALNSRLMVLDQQNGFTTLKSVDITSGTRTLIFQDNNPFPDFQSDPPSFPLEIIDIIPSPVDSNAFLALIDSPQTFGDLLISLDKDSGQATLVTRISAINGLAARFDVLVGDSQNATTVYLASDRNIVSIDLLSNVVTLLLAREFGTGQIFPDFLVDMIVHPQDETKLIVLDFSGDVFVFDLLTNEFSILAPPFPKETNIPRQVIANPMNSQTVLISDHRDVLELDVLSGQYISSTRAIPPFSGFSSVVHAISADPRNNTSILAAINGEIFSLDLVSGNLSLVSTANDDPSLRIYRDQAFGSFSRQNLVVSPGDDGTVFESSDVFEGIVSIDLETGVRERIAGNEQFLANDNLPRTGLGNESSIDIDANNGKLYIANRQLDAVIEYDLNEDSRQVKFSGIADPEDIQLSNGKLFVLDDEKGLLEHDLVSDQTKIISTPFNPEIGSADNGLNDPFTSAQFTVILEDFGEAFSTRFASQSSVRFDLSNGDRSRGPQFPGVGTHSNLAYDSVSNQLLVVRKAARSLSLVNRSTQQSQLISINSTPNAENIFESASNLIFDPLLQQLLMVDSAKQALFFVSDKNGGRNSIPICSNTSDGARLIDNLNVRSNVIDHPFDVNKLLFYNIVDDELISVDKNSGECFIVSDASEAVASQSFRASLLAHPTDRSKVIVHSPSLNLSFSVYTIDLESGRREVIANETIGDGPSLASSVFPAKLVVRPNDPFAIAVGQFVVPVGDGSNSFFLFKRVIRLNLQTGNREILLDEESGDILSFFDVETIEANPMDLDKLFILERVPFVGRAGFDNQFIEFDMVSGDSRVIRFFPITTKQNRVIDLIDLVFDESKGTAILADGGVNLFLIDTVTGETVYLSR